MKFVIVLTLILSAGSFAAMDSSSEQLVEEARVMLKQGNTEMASSLINLVLMSDRKNPKALELKSKIEQKQKGEQNSKSKDLSASL